MCNAAFECRSAWLFVYGLSPNASGGYAEQVLAQSSLMFEVPNGLDADSAAMTEPMAVALHAVRRSRVKQVNLRL